MAMKIITDERCTSYSQPGHPERPERIIAACQRLRSQTELSITWTKPRPARRAALLRAHSDFVSDRSNSISHYARRFAG